MTKYIEVEYPSLQIPVGSKVKFFSEKQKYNVMASNACFLICTKPFNAKKTVLYTIIDRKLEIRGPEDLVFGMGAETKEDCEEMLKRLTNGETEVSHRNRKRLDVDKYFILKDCTCMKCEQCKAKIRENLEKEMN